MSGQQLHREILEGGETVRVPGRGNSSPIVWGHRILVTTDDVGDLSDDLELDDDEGDSDADDDDFEDEVGGGCYDVFLDIGIFGE